MVVMEFKTSNGVSVRIHDDAYAGISQTEMDRRIREAQRTAWRIAEAKARREVMAEKDPSLRSG